jgi:hypothetical protein
MGKYGQKKYQREFATLKGDATIKCVIKGVLDNQADHVSFKIDAITTKEDCKMQVFTSSIEADKKANKFFLTPIIGPFLGQFLDKTDLDFYARFFDGICTNLQDLYESIPADKIDDYRFEEEDFNRLITINLK